MMRLVKENPFVPIAWMIDHEGMQGTQYFSEDQVKDLLLVEDWLEARTTILNIAKSFHDKGLTKQIVNRLIEPFLWHTVIVTGSEWENFFALRNHPAADIHIQELAKKMMDVYNASTPKSLMAGEWHIPFGDKFDENRVAKAAGFASLGYTNYSKELEIQTKIKIATARCARMLS